MSDRLKTLLVGFGGIARGLADDGRMAAYFPIATHAQAIKASPDLEWVGVVDTDQAARDVATNDWGVPAFAKIEDAANTEPDILVLATPPGGRAASPDALPSVRGVLVEKPLGDTDGHALIAACHDRQIPVQVNYWRRGDETLRERAGGGLTGKIGALQLANGVYGNGFANNGSHLVDMIRMLLGEPVWVRALSRPQEAAAGPLNGDVQLAFALGMENNTVVTAHPLDFEHYREVGLDIWGTSGRMQLQQETLAILHHSRTENRGLTDEFEIASDKIYKLGCTVANAIPNLYANLCDAVSSGTPLLSPAASAIKTEDLISLILRSAEQNGTELPVTAQP